MRIAALGTGNMARNLVGRWAEGGHVAFFGSRDPRKAKEVAAEVGFGAEGGSNDEAVDFAEVLFHSVRIPPGEFLSAPERLAGKVIIDINNHDFPRDHSSDSLIPSLAERTQEAHPQARVVKAFNTMAMEIFNHAPEELLRENVSAFLAGNDAEALDTVSQLARDLGLHPVIAGGLDAAWLLEVQGDFIRNLIFKNSDFLATVSTRTISNPPPARFGGRPAEGY